MKNWKKIVYFALISSTGLLVAPITCNSIFAKSKATDEGYETVNATGSFLSKKVKKGDAPTGSGDNTSTMSADQLDRMRQMQAPMGVKGASGG